ncbi:hypothetical protein GOBAR_AA02011 [Gossypium barbadense]|uniref:Uncharacterized protein n=1 Tax=Gossypium barbadense TaxID=3634 RepID=A0A2P5YSP4_GOSBA|nr:hypothetical protein GOBAR_AA02011 [Gossypium barbadense]
MEEEHAQNINPSTLGSRRNKNSFQNTNTTLKNQQASIQGLETQIEQLAKLISERPQGSLPSNTKSNPREQLNAIAIQDEEGLVAKPRPEMMVSKGKNEVGQNDPKPTQKLRTPDKLKPSEDELNTSPNQPKVGDKVLLDAADPRVTTSEPNKEIPLTVLSVFPYGTVEAHGRALGRAHTIGGDMAGRYSRVKIGLKYDLLISPIPKL